MNLKHSSNRLPILLALLSLFTFGQPGHAARLEEVKQKDREVIERHWIVRPGFNVGYAHMMDGYDGYEDLGNVGLDLYIQHQTQGSDSWLRNFWLRMSLDYFPLQVPEGNNGLTEDLYSANASFLYNFERIFKWKPWVTPFLGIGYGMYRDVVELDTPATGKITSSENYKGLVASAGINLPPMKLGIPFMLKPEVRYHRYKTLGGSSSHITYQISVMLWPPKKAEK